MKSTERRQSLLKAARRPTPTLKEPQKGIKLAVAAAAAAGLTLGGAFDAGVRRSAAFHSGCRRSVGFIAHVECPLRLLRAGVLVVVASRCFWEAVADPRSGGRARRPCRVN